MQHFFGSQPMERYIGTKIISAKPMTRGAYNRYRGWTIPEDENPADEGYLVEYQDSPTKNTPDHDNYVSWSPKDVFDRAYRKTDGMSFGLAVEAMKKGHRVARYLWDKGNLIFLDGNGDILNGQCMWAATQDDLLTNDWYIVEEAE